jgi:hypothetical protein
MTFFIRTPLPLSEAHAEVLAAHHREHTGNELSIISNGALSECLVKCNCAHPPEEVIPMDMVVTEIIADIDVARDLITSESWRAA